MILDREYITLWILDQEYIGQFVLYQEYIALLVLDRENIAQFVSKYSHLYLRVHTENIPHLVEFRIIVHTYMSFVKLTSS